MIKYEIELYENDESEDSLIFDCEADNENEAANMAIKNYPDCILLGIVED
jgi:hypothetical protein